MYTCESCIWKDKCDCAGVCEDYYSGDDEAIALREYEQDLQERAEIYQEIIEEQDS